MEIRIATTPGEMEQIYLLRYRCYVEELGWKYDQADAAAKELRDPMDATGLIYYAEEGGRVVATYCVHVPDGYFKLPDKWRNHYALDRFAEFPEECFSFSSRLMVAQEHRGSMAVPKMLIEAYAEGWRRGTRFNFCFCRPRLIDLYERLGFIRYKDNIFEPTQGYMSPMVLINEDAEHLQAVRSPFLRVCKSNQPDSTVARWFDRNFPDARESTAKQTVASSDFMNRWTQAMNTRSAVLLEGFTPEQSRQLLMSGTVLQCKAGDRLLREGEAGHEMFLLIEGSAHVMKNWNGDKEAIMETLNPGEIFGELALLSKTKRNATVQAATDLQVLVISQDFLQSAMRCMPDIAMKLLFNLASLLCVKLQTSSDRIMELMRENAALPVSRGATGKVPA